LKSIATDYILNTTSLVLDDGSGSGTHYKWAWWYCSSMEGEE